MADVTSLLSRREEGRGQLILVAGLVMALGIVALVLLLNTAIFTQHLATQELTAEEDEAIAFRNAAIDGVGGAIVRENSAGYDSRTNLRENVTDDTERTFTLLRQRGVERGVWQMGDNIQLSDGALLRQTDSSRQLTSSSGARNWTLATDVSDARRFRIHINSGGLAILSDLTNEAFRVNVEGASNTWQLFVHEDSLTGEPVISVKNGTQGSPTEDVCSPGSDPSINLTAGTVDGDRCTAIQFGKGVTPPYTISYTRGDNAMGQYNLTVNTTAGVQSANFNGTSGPSPYELPAVYDVRVVIQYDGPGIRYTAPLRVAPGEPDE